MAQSPLFCVNTFVSKTLFIFAKSARLCEFDGIIIIISNNNNDAFHDFIPFASSFRKARGERKILSEHEYVN